MTELFLRLEINTVLRFGLTIDKEDAATVLEICGYILKAVPDSSINLHNDPFHPRNTALSKMKDASRLSLAAEAVRLNSREVAAIYTPLKSVVIRDKGKINACAALSQRPSLSTPAVSPHHVISLYKLILP